MGATGYLYASAKDQLKWASLSPKRWLYIVMAVGRYMVMDDEAWQKQKTKIKSESDRSMAAALIAAFGDGTKK